MGNISYNIKYLSKEKINYKSEIDSILVDFNNSLSTYISDSELSMFNNVDTLFNISNELYTILKFSDKIYRNTKGAFDPTIGKLVNLWGFGPKKILETPDSLKVRETLKNVGTQVTQTAQRVNSASGWGEYQGGGGGGWNQPMKGSSKGYDSKGYDSKGYDRSYDQGTRQTV